MTRKQELEYIRNTAGGATVENFIEDWSPIGSMAWALLVKDDLAEIDIHTARIKLTAKGEEALEALS